MSNDTARRLSIVRAGSPDAATVHDLAREFAAADPSLAGTTTTEERWRGLLATDDVTVLVATLDGEVVGHVSAVRSLHLRRGREIVALDDLYVRPQARNAGIGAALMHTLAERDDGKAIRWEIEEGNLSAQRFSLRLGAAMRRKVIAWWEP